MISNILGNTCCSCLLCQECSLPPPPPSLSLFHLVSSSVTNEKGFQFIPSSSSGQKRPVVGVNPALLYLPCFTLKHLFGCIIKNFCVFLFNHFIIASFIIMHKHFSVTDLAREGEGREEGEAVCPLLVWAMPSPLLTAQAEQDTVTALPSWLVWINYKGAYGWPRSALMSVLPAMEENPQLAGGPLTPPSA